MYKLRYVLLSIFTQSAAIEAYMYVGQAYMFMKTLFWISKSGIQTKTRFITRSAWSQIFLTNPCCLGAKNGNHNGNLNFGSGINGNSNGNRNFGGINGNNNGNRNFGGVNGNNNGNNNYGGINGNGNGNGNRAGFGRKYKYST